MPPAILIEIREPDVFTDISKKKKKAFRIRKIRKKSQQSECFQYKVASHVWKSLWCSQPGAPRHGGAVEPPLCQHLTASWSPSEELLC